LDASLSGNCEDCEDLTGCESLPKLLDANRNYKLSVQKPGEDKDLAASAEDRVDKSSDPAAACAEDRADWSSDPPAALMEIKDSDGAHQEKILEPEASHCTLEQKDSLFVWLVVDDWC
jgi:hypothetical protein